MINNESLMVDVLEDTNRDVVLYPDRFSVVLSAFYYSKKLQQWICASSMSALRSYYCHGTSSGWRSAVTGTLYIDLDNYPDPTGNVPVALPPPETRMEYYDFYMKRVRTFLASPSTQDACLINYLIPSNVASVDVARRMAAAMGATFVFPSPDGYYSSDGSHLRPESSERWSTEFTKLADRHVDECMRIGKPGVF